MIYAFGKIPKHANDDLLEFIRNNDGLFVLPEDFIHTYGSSVCDLSGITQDSERIIVAGYVPSAPGSTEKALLFSEGKQIAINNFNSRQYIYVDGCLKQAEIRVCSDIANSYTDDCFDILLHPSSGSFYVDRYNIMHRSPRMQSKLVVSSSYNEGKILVDGKNVGNVGETGEGIEYAFLNSLDLEKYL